MSDFLCVPHTLLVERISFVECFESNTLGFYIFECVVITPKTVCIQWYTGRVYIVSYRLVQAYYRYIE